MPNTIAWRYGIGLGDACLDVVGLRRVARKLEWSVKQATATPNTIRSTSGASAGSRDIRELDLDDGSSRIHGTNVPGTIGNAEGDGCIRLVDDDVIDLYSRVPLGTRVVISD